MDLICEERLSDSPYVETIWRGHSQDGGAFISMASSHSNLVVTRIAGRTLLTVRGPETRATPALAPPDAEFTGILFKPGTFLPLLPSKTVMDRRDVTLPDASSQSFWLHGSSWQFPDFDNVETFVDWLARDGVLVHDPVAPAVLKGEPPPMSQRSLQRRLVQATGLTQSAIRQIERARYATSLLRQGVSILDTIFEAGYFDQPHLTRSLRHFVGLTPAQVLNPNRPERLSFLYKTASPWLKDNMSVQSTTKGDVA